MSKLLIFIITISISGATVFGDYLIKRASLLNSFWTKWLLAGAVVYSLTAIGWLFVMKNIKLSTIGVLYGVSTTILLVALGVFVFHEKLSILEMIGILFGLISIVFLYRFS